MHDPFKARPVSGEIMTGAIAGISSPPGSAQNDHHDIVEAEFETLRPVTGIYQFRGGPANAPEGVELPSQAVRPARREGERGGVAFWMTGAALIVLAFLASGGYVLMIGGGRQATTTEGDKIKSFHTASVSPREADAEARGGSMKPHFLGTSAGSVKPQGSFVFSDRLEAPKDGEKSVIDEEK